MTNKQKNRAESGKNGLPLAPVRGQSLVPVSCETVYSSSSCIHDSQVPCTGMEPCNLPTRQGQTSSHICTYKRGKRDRVNGRCQKARCHSGFQVNGIAKLGDIRKWQVKRHYVSSSPAETSLLAIRMIWLLSSLTLMILAQQLGIHCKAEDEEKKSSCHFGGLLHMARRFKI